MNADALAAIASAAAMAASALAAAAAYRVHVQNRSGVLFTALATLCAAGMLAASATGAPPSAAACFAAILTAAAAVAAFDARLFLIPDGLVVVLAALALAAPFAPPPLTQALGAVALGGLFLAVRLFYRRVRGRDGLGLGDVKFAAAMGLMLGAERGLIAVAGAALIAAAWLAWRRSPPVAAAAPGPIDAPAAPFGVALALALIAGLALDPTALTWGAPGWGPA